MRADYFIAKRIAFDDKGSNSRWIIRIAIGAIALCMAVMITASALIRGFKSEIQDKVYGFWGHINVTNVGVQTTQDEVPIQISAELLDELRGIDQATYERQRSFLGFTFPDQYVEDQTDGGIRHVQSYVLKAGIIKQDRILEGIILKGVDSTFDWERFGRFIKEGDIIVDTDSTVSQGILISQTTANRLEMGVGDRFRVYFLKDGNQIARGFEISGIYNTNLEEYDRRFAIADADVLRRLLNFKNDEVSGLEIFVDEVDDVIPIQRHLYNDILPPSMFPSTIQKKDPAIFEWLELQNYNEIVILTLMIIVSIINMITAILILILERTNMIGVLKALGQSNWGIRRIFLYQAGIIIGKGLLIGNAIGIALCLLQYYTSFIKLDEAEYYLSVAPIELNPWMILFLNVGTLGVILAALVIPSYFISNVSPIKAIRFK